MQGAFDAWFWDFYHEENIAGGIDSADYDVNQPNGAQVSKLNRGLKAYVADSTITAPKFAVMVLADDLGLHFPQANPYKYLNAQCDYIDGLMADSRYIRTRSSNRPYLGIYSSAAIDASHWNTCLGRMTHGTPYVVVCDGNTSQTTALGAQATAFYGPNLLPTGNGQHPFTDAIAKDITVWGGGNNSASVVLLDNSSFAATPRWVDDPTMPQIFTHVKAAAATSGSLGVYIYAWNELAEGGGGMVRTAQNGTRWIDGVRWGKNGQTRPSTYTDELTLNSLYVTTTGAGWTEVFPDPNGVVGAHDSNEIQSATTNDAKSLAHERMTQCALVAHTGPDEGIVTPNVDGVDQTDVDLYTASSLTRQLVWTSSTLSDATHTCKFTVKGTKNASSSSVNVKLDSVRVTFHPHVGAANANQWPALYALPERRRRRRRGALAA